MGNVEYADCYAELANAIVLQAFKDYRKALFKLVQERGRAKARERAERKAAKKNFSAAAVM